MSRKATKWLPLESNPAVFAQYAKKLSGPEGIYFADVFSCDDWALEIVPTPVYALILLYPIKDEIEADDKKRIAEAKDKLEKIPKSLWFIRQTVPNACGTVALLHALSNVETEPNEKGILKQFVLKTQSLNPDERGKALEESAEIEALHHDSETAGQSRVPQEGDQMDPHFVTFVLREGVICELDGRKPYPIYHGEGTGEKFLQQATSIIKKVYLDRDPTDLRFSMIALCGSAPPQDD